MSTVLAVVAIGCGTPTADYASSVSTERTDPPATTERTDAPATDQTATSIAPSEGLVIAGDSYRFVAPERWTEPPPEEVPAPIDRFVIDDRSGSNISVAFVAGETTPASVEDKAPAELERSFDAEVTVRDRAFIDGEEAAQLSAVVEQDGLELTVNQFYVSHDGRTFIITFTLNPDSGQPDADELIDSVLATWRWE